LLDYVEVLATEQPALLGPIATLVYSGLRFFASGAQKAFPAAAERLATVAHAGKLTDIFDEELPVAPRFCDHLRKHSLAQPGLKRSLRIPQQLYHCLFMRAARAACLFPRILVNRKYRGRLDCSVNFQQTDPICRPRQRRKTMAAASCST
jgi:hypothetical protein